MRPWPQLTFDGYRLLFEINKALDDPIESDDLADALDEAAERIGVGCRHCGDIEAETRFGMCYPCAFGEPG